MMTFDLAEVRGFAADLDARMCHCDNGEGLECASLDDALRHYATLCCEFRENVREWGHLDVYLTSEKAIHFYTVAGFVPITPEPIADTQEDGKPYSVMAKRVKIASA